MRKKKIAVFMLVFFAVYGIVSVDRAYSDMMDRDGLLTPQIRRVNSDYVSLSMFGETVSVNKTELAADWEDITRTVTAKLDTAVLRTREFLGIQEDQIDYSVFKTQIL